MLGFVLFSAAHQILISLLLVLLTTQVDGRRKPLRRNPCNGLPDESFIPNSRGCKYFYYCQNGKAIEAYCPQEMWFNPESSICDYPQNVKCTFDDPPELTSTTTTKRPTTKPTTLPPSSTTTEGNYNPAEEAVICPFKDSYKISFIASNVDCKRYYICYHGKPHQQECIDELHWNPNPDVLKCDLPERVNCKVSL